jgi:uncharacterized protein (DUF1684 family)
VSRIGSAPACEIRLPERAPAQAGTIEFRGGHATLRMGGGEAKELKSDHGQKPDLVKIGGLELTLIERGKRIGIRMRDPEAAARRDFRGLHWYAVNPTARVTGAFHPYNPPKQIPITNVLGDTQPQPSPGYVEFSLNGKTMRLDPVVEEPGDLFFMFKDETSATDTYGAGRFLHAAMAKDGLVELDFNKAYNPPCAYTAFATCPLPPRQNHLATRITAGEKRYGAH